MKTKRTHWLLLPILLSGCMAGDEPYTPVANLQELMATVVDPAADFYWDAVGWIVDSTGTEEIRPRSPEEWDLVRNAAFVVAEIEVAEARDPMAVFDVGAEMYAVCTGCHATYALETIRPGG